MPNLPWQVRRGRRLQWSPSWPDSDAELVFDAASGDYWVLSQSASGLLRRLADGQAFEATDPGAIDDGVSNVQDLLAELQRHGLVSPPG